MNDLGTYAQILDRIPAWTGSVPPGYAADFLGILTAKDFLGARAQHPSTRAQYALRDEDAQPRLAAPALGGGKNGEFWFEAANWVIAAQDARERFVMASLGAFYGYQAVGCHRALSLVNPMPCRLVAVEPLAEKMQWLRRHMRDNGIDPDRQWLIQAAVNDSNEPVLFPVGAPGLGGHNCVATNCQAARQGYASTIVAEGRTEQALASLLLHNSTGIAWALGPERSFTAEIKYVSSVTLGDILGPLDLVDYLEADLQQSEMVVFPPFMDLLKRKVRRVHVGTHGRDVHAMLHSLFAERGWEIVFSYLPESVHECPLGTFSTNDGILTVRNPAV
jgi:hypothetical protein